MDSWHAFLYAKNQEFRDVLVGQEAAQAWVEGKLRDLGYTGELNWELSADACTVFVPPDASAVIRPLG